PRTSPRAPWSLSARVSNTARKCTQTVLALESAATSRKERSHMAQVAKVVTIIGNSPESFAKAAEAAVQEAAKTIRGIRGVDVVEMSAVVENARISEYRTTVNIAFAVER